jgi:hypothetical protein
LKPVEQVATIKKPVEQVATIKKPVEQVATIKKPVEQVATIKEPVEQVATIKTQPKKSPRPDFQQSVTQKQHSPQRKGMGPQGGPKQI